MMVVKCAISKRNIPTTTAVLLEDGYWVHDAYYREASYNLRSGVLSLSDIHHSRLLLESHGEAVYLFVTHCRKTCAATGRNGQAHLIKTLKDVYISALNKHCLEKYKSLHHCLTLEEHRDALLYVYDHMNPAPTVALNEQHSERRTMSEVVTANMNYTTISAG